MNVTSITEMLTYIYKRQNPQGFCVCGEQDSQAVLIQCMAAPLQVKQLQSSSCQRQAAEHCGASFSSSRTEDEDKPREI